MTAQRAALRRVKAFLATFTAKDDGQRLCATAIDSTFTNPRLVKFTVADLHTLVALAERAMEAESHVDAFVTLNFECFTTGETAPRDGCVCPTCITVDEAQKFLAPPGAGKRADRPSARAARSRKNRP